MKIGELIRNVFTKLAQSRLLIPNTETFNNLLDIEYCTKHLNLISQSQKYSLFLKGDNGEGDSDLVRKRNQRRYYSIENFNFVHDGDRYFLCSQIEESQRVFFEKWIMDEFGLDLLPFGESAEVIIAKKIYDKKYVFFLKKYYPCCDINITTSGPDGEKGELTNRVLNFLQMSNVPREFLEELHINNRSYVFVPVAPYYPQSKIDLENSRVSIVKKMKLKRNAWVPLMGTGNGQIPLSESFNEFCNLLIELSIQYRSHIPTIIVEIPEDEKFITFCRDSNNIKKLNDVIWEKFVFGEKFKSELLSDEPTLNDTLNRLSLAESFFDWIDCSKLYEKESMMLLVGADWGEGKTSFAYSLKEIAFQKKWNFFLINAWEYQRFMPNWWGVICSLESQILDTNKKRVKFWLKGFKKISRENILNIFIFISLIVSISVLYATKWLESIREILEFSLAIQLISWLLPLKKIKNIYDHKNEVDNDKIITAKFYFERLINFQKEIINGPIVIVIDDIDRCESSNLYFFLEGLRNFFKEKGVVFIVCADEAYLVSCVSAHFKEEACFHDSNQDDELKNKFGAKFLQKIFQGSMRLNKRVELSSVGNILKYTYLHKELVSNDGFDTSEVKKGREQAGGDISYSGDFSTNAIKRKDNIVLVNDVIRSTLEFIGEKANRDLTPRGIKRWHNYLSLIFIVLDIENVDLASDKQLQNELALISLLNSCYYDLYLKYKKKIENYDSVKVIELDNAFIYKKSFKIYLGIL